MRRKSGSWTDLNGLRSRLNCTSRHKSESVVFLADFWAIHQKLPDKELGPLWP